MIMQIRHRSTLRPTLRRVLPVLVVLLFVPVGDAGGQASTAHRDPGDMLARAEGALAAGRAAAAEELYRSILAENPGLVDAYRGLARSLGVQERGGEAAEILAGLGRGLLDAERAAAAADVLTEASRLAPPSVELLALLGKARLFARDHPAAIEALGGAVAAGDRRTPTRLYLAAALWEDGRFGEAETVYRELLAEGTSFVALHQLGRLLHWRGRSEEALPLLRRAARLRPSAADVAYDLAQALDGAGEAAAAIEVYRRAVELAPSSYKAHYGLAMGLARQGERVAAEASLAAYRRLYADEQRRTHAEGRERARLDQGWALLDAGDIDAALEHFEALEPGVEALAGRAAAHARRGEHARAVKLLERAVSLAPDRRDLRLCLAEERLRAVEDPDVLDLDRPATDNRETNPPP